MGLRVYILKNGGDYSNGGISGQVSTLAITNIGGPFNPTEDAPAAMLKNHVFDTVIAVPEDIPENMVGPMAGGTYIISSDSRFGAKLRELGLTNSYVAIPFHDRFETAETARLLSL